MQMLKRGVLALGLAGLVMSLVMACGGGGGGESFAGIDRLGVTTGTINGFGSVIVSGVEYETDGTTFDIDDSGSGNQSDLRVGQQVTIEWDSIDDGVTRRARSVIYDDTLEGPIASIDAANQTLVILGQVVIVDLSTSFDEEIDLSGLSVDDEVEVSGLIDGNGVIRATRIDISEATEDFEVRGVVAGLDTVNSTFFINGLIVDYLDVLNPPDLANGQFVEVEGEGLGSDTLIATKVEIEDGGIPGADDSEDREGEVEGYVTAFSSAASFSVSGVPVTTNGQTTYEDGVAGDLALNVRVEVEGDVTSGVLVARKVEFKSGDDDDDGDDDSIDGRVEGNVTAVNAGAGTLTIAGVSVTVTVETRFEDQTGAAGQAFGLDDISVGNYVEARGDPGTGAALTAAVVERENAITEGLLLRGPASAINAGLGTLDVLGLPVTTKSGTVYRDDDDNAINAAAFFAAISTGSEVQVKFTQGGTPIVADELELEDADD